MRSAGSELVITQIDDRMTETRQYRPPVLQGPAGPDRAEGSAGHQSGFAGQGAAGVQAAKRSRRRQIGQLRRRG
jgi:hypothetical protein